MPSPFPGMDPFIEAQEWSDFHGRLNAEIANTLQPQLRPAYVVRIERRIYVEHPRNDSERAQSRVADVTIHSSAIDGGRMPAPSRTSIATDDPVECEVVVSTEHRESYLVVRDAEDDCIVTVIETLSPSNKRKGSKGWRKYIHKRDQVLDSESHLVELDLLRGGTRMPIVPRPQTPVGDYRIMISRSDRRPRVKVHAWPLMQPLPTIAIPLLGKEEHVELDLQRAVTAVYEQAAYELSLDYAAELDPPLPEDVRAWLRGATSTTRR